LEQEMRQLGADRITLMNNNRRLYQMESLSHYGEALTQAGVEAIAKVVWKHQRAIGKGKAGRKYAYLYPLLRLPARKTAATAMRCVVDSISHVNKLHAMAYELADKLWMEAMLHRATRLERMRHKRVRRRYRHKKEDVLRMQNTEIWTPQEKLATGVFLIHMVAEHTGLITIYKDQVNNRTVPKVRVTDTCLAYIQKVEEASTLLCPFNLPMVVPPRPWSNPKDGGYLTDMPGNVLLKDNLDLVTDHCTGEEPFIKAANLQQSVPWKINSWVLDHLQYAWDQSLSIGKLLPREGYPIPPYPKHLPDDHPDVTLWRFNARRLHDLNDRTRLKRIVTAKQLWVAGRLKAEPQLYFPMQLDFRGRYYYRPPFVNPQGNDVGRALLLFANGTPINTEAEANWLRIHGANLYGHSKLTWQARLDWVHEHQLQIEAAGRDPWAQPEFWTNADDPWQFIAFCREYQQFSEHGYGFVCHLPVVLDCTCSGIQHYSALLRSQEMAELVNLLPSDKPMDIYTAVLEKVLEQLRTDAAADDPHAKSWLELQPDRSLTKPVVMTLPYSATRSTVLRKCQEWAWDRAADLYGPDAWTFKSGSMAGMHYMATILGRETALIVGPAKRAMSWLRKLGHAAGTTESELEWTTPSGLRVRQRYPDYRKTEIVLHYLSSVSMRLKLQVDELGLNPSRMGNGLSPNLIHSLDASHMALTTIDAFANGVRNLGGIHDCWASTPAEMEQVRISARDAFAAMYQQDWFTTITDELLLQLPPDVATKMPARPRLGALDVTAVQQSDYFIT
jgi:DNA-directed RNA polymerase, mitochondrial